MRRISILMYNVNREKQAFVTVGLSLLDVLDFPVIELEEEVPYEKNDYVISLTEDYLKTVLSNYMDVSLRYDGESYEGDTLTLVFEVSMNHLNSYIVTTSTIWFATLHEIINTNMFLTVPISQNVIENIKNNIEHFSEFSVPRVCYDGGKREKIMFESLFGMSKCEGVYQFFDLDTAVEKSSKENSKTILRYAVFEDSDSTTSYDMFQPLTLHNVPAIASHPEHMIH